MRGRREGAGEERWAARSSITRRGENRYPQEQQGRPSTARSRRSHEARPRSARPGHKQGRPAVTREHKLALIIGFSVFLVVGVLVGDYFSKARMAKVDPTLAQGGLPTRLDPAVVEPVDPIDRPLPGTGRTTGPDVVVEKAGLRPPGVGIEEITMGVKRGLAEEDVVPAPGGGSGTPAAADEVYTVQAGDSLYKIASKQMGDGRLAGKLGEYNKAVLKGGDRLSVGMQLKIPAAEAASGKGKGAVPAPTPPNDGLKPKQEIGRAHV